MLIGQKGVKYGLTIKQPTNGNAAAKAKKPSVFGAGDSDDDHDKVEQQIARQQVRKQDDKKVAELHAAALAEDASVFDYDGHYDAIQEAREEPKRREKAARQSRYIAGLLEKAEERKREQDVLYERQMLKERAAEDHLFGDKERFVTAAYKAKLAEDQRIVAEQKRKQAEEEADAVEKKGHMGDFYRNLLRNNAAFGTARQSQGGTAVPAGGSQGNTHRGPGAGTTASGAASSGAGASARQGMEEEAQEPAFDPTPSKLRGAEAGRGGASPVSPARMRSKEEQEPAGPGPLPQRLARRPAGSEDEEEREERPPGAPRPPPVDRQDAVAAARERYLARKRKVAGA